LRGIFGTDRKQEEGLVVVGQELRVDMLPIVVVFTIVFARCLSMQRNYVKKNITNIIKKILQSLASKNSIYFISPNLMSL